MTESGWNKGALRLRVSLMLAVVALGVRVSVGQATLLVPQQFGIPQYAVNVAVPGDEIVVSAGTYPGFDFKGKALRVRSVDGPDVTVLLPAISSVVPGEPKSVVSAHSGEQQDSVLEGFTLRGFSSATSVGPSRSRGLYITASNPLISNCIVERHWPGNGIDGFAYGTLSPIAYHTPATNGRTGACALISSGASPRFENCLFRDSQGGEGGACAQQVLWSGATQCVSAPGSYGVAGVALRSASVMMVDCEFSDLGFGGALGVGVSSFAALRECHFMSTAIRSAGRVDVRHCVVSGPSSIVFSGGPNYVLGCLFVDGYSGGSFGNAAIEHCTFAGNTTSPWLRSGSIAQNCIFWNDLDPTQPVSAYKEWTNWHPMVTVESSLFRGAPYPDPGNIMATEPGFVDAANGDYHLRWDSPAVNAGQTGVISPNNTDIDGQPRRLGSGFDMGADEAVCVGLGRLEDPMASAETLDLAWTEGQTSTPLAGELLGSGAEAGIQGVAALSLASGMTTSGAVTLHLDANNVLAVFINFDANGEFRLPLDVGDPSLAGAVVYMQVFAAKSTGTSSSNGLEMIFCP